MNAKSIFACCLIIALVASSAQALMIKKTQEHKMVKNFAMGVQHNLFDAFHLQFDESSDVSQDFMTDFITFAMGEPDILNSIMNNQSLSEESAGKIKEFFKGNQGFSDMLMGAFQGDDTPDCLKNLSDAQKRKIVSIIIDQMDFTSLLNGGDSSLDEATQQKIMDAVSSDPDLGDDISQCAKDHPEVFSSSA